MGDRRQVVTLGAGDADVGKGGGLGAGAEGGLENPAEEAGGGLTLRAVGLLADPAEAPEQHPQSVLRLVGAVPRQQAGPRRPCPRWSPCRPLRGSLAKPTVGTCTRARRTRLREGPRLRNVCGSVLRGPSG